MKISSLSRRLACNILLAAALLTLPAANAAAAPAAQGDPLASLRKIDDFPLYIMNYGGDYHFAEFLRHGASNLDELNRFLADRRLTAQAVRDEPGPECSCFKAANGTAGVLFGRNYDLKTAPPALLLFTRPPGGYASVSMVNLNTLRLATGKKGAPDIAGNILAAPYFPADGMNEHGVAVAILTVPTAAPGYDPSKVSLMRWQVSRLILDYARSVDEAIELMGQYNVTVKALGTSVHYFIADAAGNSAVLEFVDGRMQVLRSAESWQAVTNFILSSETGGEGRRRYARLAGELAASDGALSEAAAMELLRAVSLETTRWSAVYNLSAREISLSLGKQYGTVRKYGVKPFE